MFKKKKYDSFNILQDVEYTLKKLTDWRDQGGGPKIGIIDNFDERLDNILTGIFIYYDFIAYTTQRL